MRECLGKKRDTKPDGFGGALEKRERTTKLKKLGFDRNASTDVLNQRGGENPRLTEENSGADRKFAKKGHTTSKKIGRKQTKK